MFLVAPFAQIRLYEIEPEYFKKIKVKKLSFLFRGIGGKHSVYCSVKEYGNILKKTHFRYLDLSEPLVTYTYQYQSSYQDQLVRVKKKEADVTTTYHFTYNETHHPILYKNKTLEWRYINKLTKYDDVNFTYNGFGERIKKSTHNSNITYLYDKGRLIEEKHLERDLRIRYQYDAFGVMGFSVGRKEATSNLYQYQNYFYQKNLLGDILSIIDSNGIVVGTYQYDGYGSMVVNNLTTDALASLNPFRYRGYYYDTETGLYYLKARYYDPELGRFISPDDISFLNPEMINGLNLYAYCGGNPVMMVDETGCTPEWLKWLGIGVAFLGALLVIGAITILTAGVGTTILAGTLAGAVLHGAAVGALIGASVGIVAGGIIGGTISNWSVEGILLGITLGFGGGALAGAIIGAAWGGITYGMQQAGLMATKVPINSIINNPADEFITLGPKVGKITQYIHSISQSGSYGQIFVTKVTNTVYQIANGHHRIAALTALGYEFVKVYITK